MILAAVLMLGVDEAAGWRVETVWECEMKDEAALKARLKALLDSAPLRPAARQGESKR